MASEDKKKIKTFIKVSSNKNMEKDNINSMLNDDCLVHIFEYLTLPDKINLEKVCIRWDQVTQTLWKSIKSLEIDKYKEYLKSFDTVEEKTQFYINVIKRCGRHLTKLYIDNENQGYQCGNVIKYSEILNIVPKFCHNLIYFNLRDSNFWVDNIVQEDTLEKIFIKNKNLKSISISNSDLEGNCFLKLNANNIEEIILDQCRFTSKNYINRFLKNCKNVKNFELKAFEEDETGLFFALNAFIKSECKDLLKFSYDCGENGDVDFQRLNYEFFRNNKKLRHFVLKSLYFADDGSENFIDNLPDSLEILEIQAFYLINLINCRLPNLIALKLEINWDGVNDEYIEKLTNFINLKELDLNIEKCLLTPAGEAYFSSFKNLETFSLNIKLQKNIDNILIALAECKNLIKININNEFTKFGLESISLLPKLESLNVSRTSVRDENLIDFIRKSLKLRKLLAKYI